MKTKSGIKRLRTEVLELFDRLLSEDKNESLVNRPYSFTTYTGVMTQVCPMTYNPVSFSYSTALTTRADKKTKPKKRKANRKKR